MVGREHVDYFAGSILGLILNFAHDLKIENAVVRVRNHSYKEFLMEKILFGERLKNAREASSMSQKTMANRIGVKPATVEKWENGEMDPRANRLQMLASMLNVPLLWLIAGSQKVPDPTAGITNREMMRQKIADLDSMIDLLKGDLDELRVLAEASD